MNTRVLSNLFHTRKILYESLISRKNIYLTYSNIKHRRQFFTNINQKLQKDVTAARNKTDNASIVISTKHKVFHDKDSEVIFDVDEEKDRITFEELNVNEIPDPFVGINLKRGISGVFEIEDLVSLLRRDNAIEIFVASVPSVYAYVDYIVVVTGKSKRHMVALCEFVRKVYKLKKSKSDILPKIEGKDSKDWLALDLGNIALHVLSPSARRYYDLETLWAVGTEYDDLSNKPKDMDIMDQYNTFLQEFQPADA